MLLKNIHIYSLNLLSFAYIVVFGVETELETVMLVILEQAEFQIFFIQFNYGCVPFNHDGGGRGEGQVRKPVFYKNHL